jgi:hypothetical protein
MSDASYTPLSHSPIVSRDVGCRVCPFFPVEDIDMAVIQATKRTPPA